MNLYFAEFKFLVESGNVEVFSTCRFNIIKEDGTPVELEEIYKLLPNIYHLE